MNKKKIILTADDYGMSEFFDNVIEDLIVKKIITSTSVLVNRIRHQDSTICKKLSGITFVNDVSIGLHFEAKEGDDYKKLLNEQFVKFNNYFSRKPDYIDVHAPHKLGRSIIVVWHLINSYGTPVRNMGQNVGANITTASPAYIATEKSKEEIISWIANLGPGRHEIVFHPGEYDPNCMSSLNEKRRDDTDMVKVIKSYIDTNPELECCNYTL